MINKISLYVGVLLTILIFTKCSSTQKESIIEIEWLNSVKNTEWISQSSNKTLEFNSSGMEIDTQNYIDLEYYNSTTTYTGMYFSDIEFPPSQWYLFELYSSTQLNQYGPFLSSNDVEIDSNKKTILYPL